MDVEFVTKRLMNLVQGGEQAVRNYALFETEWYERLESSHYLVQGMPPVRNQEALIGFIQADLSDDVRIFQDRNFGITQFINPAMAQRGFVRYSVNHVTWVVESFTNPGIEFLVVQSSVTAVGVAVRQAQVGIPEGIREGRIFEYLLKVFEHQLAHL